MACGRTDSGWYAQARNSAGVGSTGFAKPRKLNCCRVTWTTSWYQPDTGQGNWDVPVGGRAGRLLTRELLRPSHYRVERHTLKSDGPLEGAMNTDRLTTKSREVITTAAAIADKNGHATVEPWHLLLSLLDTGGSTATALIRAVGANPADIRRAAARAVENLPRASGPSVADPTLSREFVNALQAAEQIARPIGDEYISTEHILAGLAQVGGDVARALKQAGATEE